MLPPAPSSAMPLIAGFSAVCNAFAFQHFPLSMAIASFTAAIIIDSFLSASQLACH